MKPRTTEELQAANPRVLGHSFENETPYAEQWHLGIDRRLFAATALELTYAGSAGKHIVFCYNPNEVQPGIGSQESRRLIQPLNSSNNMVQCDPRNSSNYHSGQLKLTQRFHNGLQLLGAYTYGKSLDYGGSAASGAGAVGQSPDRHEPRGRVTVHPGSTCAIAPWSAGSTSCRGDPTGTGCARAACSAKSSAAGSLPASRR